MVFSIGAGEEEGSVEKLGQRDVIKYITQKNQSQETKNSGAWILKMLPQLIYYGLVPCLIFRQLFWKRRFFFLPGSP